MMEDRTRGEERERKKDAFTPLAPSRRRRRRSRHEDDALTCAKRAPPSWRRLLCCVRERERSLCARPTLVAALARCAEPPAGVARPVKRSGSRPPSPTRPRQPLLRAPALSAAASLLLAHSNTRAVEPVQAAAQLGEEESGTKRYGGDERTQELTVTARPSALQALLSLGAHTWTEKKHRAKRALCSLYQRGTRLGARSKVALLA